MTINKEIKIVKAWLDMLEALTPPEMLRDSSPVISAIRRVCEYAEKHYKKEFAKETMDTLTKILTEEKDENSIEKDSKKH